MEVCCLKGNFIWNKLEIPMLSNVYSLSGGSAFVKIRLDISVLVRNLFLWLFLLAGWSFNLLYFLAFYLYYIIQSVILQMWQKWEQSPMLTSVETHLYPLKNVPFPAVTICNVNKVSERKLHDAILGNPKSVQDMPFDWGNIPYLKSQILFKIQGSTTLLIQSYNRPWDTWQNLIVQLLTRTNY